MDKLLTLLNSIERPGSFCASGCLPLCYPGLHIDNIGLVGLPLIPEQAQKIINECQQAPFGLGEKTIIDTSVRRTWELEATQFSLQNPEWTQHMSALMLKLQESLGLETRSISYTPYKLLLYEANGFLNLAPKLQLGCIGRKL